MIIIIIISLWRAPRRVDYLPKKRTGFVIIFIVVFGRPASDSRALIANIIHLVTSEQAAAAVLQVILFCFISLLLY